MNLAITIDLSAERKKRLARALECKETELATVLQNYAVAALEEHLSMYEGDKVFTRGSDIHEYRLLLLIKHVFEGRIPDEGAVSRLFQLTATQSRALIRAVMSKYQTTLLPEIDGTLKDVLQRAEVNADSGIASVAIYNQNIVDELNRRLTGLDANHLSVHKKKDSVAVYMLQPASYLALCREFGVAPKKGP